MSLNESSNYMEFLMPSSIPRILMSNRHSCALQSESTVKNSHISPSKASIPNQYTFEPKVNSSNKARRSLQKFVEDQERHQQQKQRKLTEMREEITRWQDEQIRSIPQINSISRGRMSSNEKCESVFERLSKEKPLTQLMNSSSFSPNILPKSKELQRLKTASDLLYDDAKRRLSKHKITKQTQDKRIVALASPKINQNTNDLVRKKILSEFMNLISDSKMNPLLALSVIQELFNVKLRDVSSGFVKRIIELIANQQGEVQTEKLWSFIAVIIGNGEGCFPEKQEQQIKANYGYFYKQRINKQKKKFQPQIPNFHPQTLPSSDVLADKHRQKLCKRASEYISSENVHVNIQNQTIALEDLFIIEHQQRLKKNQRLKLQKQNQEIEKCTFKPSLSSNKPIGKPKQKIVLKRPLKQLKERDVNCHPSVLGSINSANRKNSCQKSFQPTDRVLLSNEQKEKISKRNRRSVDDSSVRMIMARTERQFQSKMTKRGYSKNENWIEEMMKRHKQVIQNSYKMKGLREY